MSASINPVDTAAPGDRAPLEANKTLYRRWFEEVVNERRTEVAPALLARDYVLHFPGLPGPVDAAAHLELLAGFHTAFPDWNERIEDVIAEGDLVAIRVTGTGTHHASFQGIPATGTRVSATGVGIARIVDGRITESWAEYDALGLLGQLGALGAD